ESVFSVSTSFSMLGVTGMETSFLIELLGCCSTLYNFYLLVCQTIKSVDDLIDQAANGTGDGSNDRLWYPERVGLSFLLQTAVCRTIENQAWEREFIPEFVLPLFTDARGKEEENLLFALRPQLTYD